MKRIRAAQKSPVCSRVVNSICQICGAKQGQSRENGEERVRVKESAKAGRSEQVLAQTEVVGNPLNEVQSRPRWLKNLCSVKTR